MADQKITYYLGAGASYHAIPTVESMNERMELFYHLINDTKILKGEFERNAALTNYNIGKALIEKFKLNVRPDFTVILSALKKHRTVDTYAKKLFLQNTKESLDKLHFLKLFLCLYFAFEQSNNESKLVINQKETDPNLAESQSKTYKAFLNSIDYRYDVFFATLLNKSFELPQNLNILSWNYDYQLELAYKEFALNHKYEKISENLGIFPYVYGAKKTETKIVKLNGTAGLLKKMTGHSGDTFHSVLQGQDGSPTTNFIDPFNTMIDTVKNLKETALSFAWEEQPIQETAIGIAIEMIKKTDVLVVIGYSFPYFNRTIDRKILTNLPHGSKLIVQCLEKDYKGIEASLNNILYNDGSPRNVKPEFYDDLSQFYIPDGVLV